MLNCPDLIRLSVWDLDVELLLDGHDDLHGVERIKSEILGEVGLEVEL